MNKLTLHDADLKKSILLRFSFCELKAAAWFQAQRTTFTTGRPDENGHLTVKLNPTQRNMRLLSRRQGEPAEPPRDRDKGSSRRQRRHRSRRRSRSRSRSRQFSHAGGGGGGLTGTRRHVHGAGGGAKRKCRRGTVSPPSRRRRSRSRQQPGCHTTLKN